MMMRSRMAQVCFVAWANACVGEAQRHETAMRRVLGRIRTRALVECLDAWVDATRDALQLKAYYAARWANLLLAKVRVAAPLQPLHRTYGRCRRERSRRPRHAHTLTRSSPRWLLARCSSCGSSPAARPGASSRACTAILSVGTYREAGGRHPAAYASDGDSHGATDRGHSAPRMAPVRASRARVPSDHPMACLSRSCHPRCTFAAPRWPPIALLSPWLRDLLRLWVFAFCRVVWRGFDEHVCACACICIHAACRVLTHARATARRLASAWCAAGLWRRTATCASLWSVGGTSSCATGWIVGWPTPPSGSASKCSVAR